MAELTPAHRAILDAYAESTAISAERRAAVEQALEVRAEQPLDLDIDIDVPNATPPVGSSVVAKVTVVSIVGAVVAAGVFTWTGSHDRGIEPTADRAVHESTVRADEPEPLVGEPTVVDTRPDDASELGDVAELDRTTEFHAVEADPSIDAPDPEARQSVRVSPRKRRVSERSAQDTSSLQADDGDELTAEVEALRAATELNAAGRHARAIARLDAWEQRHRGGALGEAREVARLIALCGLGRQTELEKRRERFLARHPKSAHRARVSSLCVTDER
jgi:hypothetical protein